MINPVSRTLSLSFVTLAAFAVSASAAPSASMKLGAKPADNTRAACATTAEVDRGWEDQQRLVDRRLAEKVAEGLAFPGAIVVPPFKSFAPYRTDVPVIAAARKTPKNSARGLDEPATRH